jgi:hypothetical protein
MGQGLQRARAAARATRQPRQAQATATGPDDYRDVRDFEIVSDMAMICCPREPCHEHCVPQTLGEAIDWARSHDCYADDSAGRTT